MDPFCINWQEWITDPAKHDPIIFPDVFKVPYDPRSNFVGPAVPTGVQDDEDSDDNLYDDESDGADSAPRRPVHQLSDQQQRSIFQLKPIIQPPKKNIMPAHLVTPPPKTITEMP